MPHKEVDRRAAATAADVVVVDALEDEALNALVDARGRVAEDVKGGRLVGDGPAPAAAAAVAGMSLVDLLMQEDVMEEVSLERSYSISKAEKRFC